MEKQNENPSLERSFLGETIRTGSEAAEQRVWKTCHEQVEGAQGGMRVLSGGHVSPQPGCADVQ